jgi:hypothetical protein
MQGAESICSSVGSTGAANAVGGVTASHRAAAVRKRIITGKERILLFTLLSA